jgi:hypothetical protein
MSALAVGGAAVAGLFVFPLGASEPAKDVAREAAGIEAADAVGVDSGM